MILLQWQQEIEQNRQEHATDILEKNKLIRMLNDKEWFFTFFDIFGSYILLAIMAGAILFTVIELFGFVLIMQNIFQNQVVNHHQGEFERLKREWEERLVELRAFQKQKRDMHRKMEYYRRQKEARLTKLKEEEEARKHEGKIGSSYMLYLVYKLLIVCIMFWIVLCKG